MDWYVLIKRFYPKYWTKEMVADAVKTEKITSAQYEGIVGEPYAA